MSFFKYLTNIKECMGAFGRINQKSDIDIFHGISAVFMWKWQRITFLSADGDDRAHQLQALIAIGIHSAGRTLHPGARLEVYGI